MRFLPLHCLLLFSSSVLFSTTGTWNVNANGNWNVGTNWTSSPLFPNGVNDNATFGGIITANRTISLGTAAQNITIGSITINDAHNYLIQSGLAGNTLIFDVTSGNASIVLPASNAGAHTISAPITLDDTLSISNGSTGNLTLSGVISGSGGITSIGSGTGVVILDAANTYAGSTNIQEGFVTYNVVEAIPFSSVVTLGDGVTPNVTLTVNAIMTSADAFALTINSDGILVENSAKDIYLSSLQGSGTINLSTTNSGANNLFDVFSNVNTTYSGAIANGALSTSTSPIAGNRFMKEGTGTLTLTGTSTYLSRTFIADGVISITNPNALGEGSGVGSGIYVRATGATGSLYLSNNITIEKNLFLNGAGYNSTGALCNVSDANTVMGNVTIGWASSPTELASNATIEVDGTSLTIDGVLSGANTLTKTGLGTLIYTGTSANTLSVATIINAGTLQLNKTSGVNALANSATINTGGTLFLSNTNQIIDSGVITLSGGTFNMNGQADTIGSLVFNSGTLTQGGSVLTLSSAAATALTLGSGTTISGDVAFTAAGGITYNGAGTRALISGDVNLSTLTHTVNIASGTDTVDLEISGAISGTGGITQSTGTGVLLFDGSTANTYSGLTTLNAGELQLNKTGVNAIGGNVTINATSTLLLGASEQIIDTSTMTLAGGTFNMNSFSETIGSLLFNSGTLTQGGGTLTLTSAAATALRMSDNTLISGPIVFGAAGGVNYNGTTTRSTINGSVDLGTFAHTFNIGTGTDSIDMEITGPISDSGSITKTGTGVLRFSGSAANTYSGLTTVTTGTLALNKTAGVNAIAGAVTVNGGTLILDAANQISNTSTLTLSSGTFNLGGFAESLGAFIYQGGTFTQSGGTLSLAGSGVALTMRNTTISGAVDLTGGGSVLFDATSNGTATLSGSLDLGGVATSFNIANGTAATDMQISGVITDGGITKIGLGQMQFSGASANTYTGLTTVTAGTLSLDKTAGVNSIGGDVLINGGTLALVTANQIIDSSTVTLSSGTFTLGTLAETIGSFDYQGGTFTQTTGALSLSSTGTALTLRNTTIPGPINITGGGSIVFDATNNGTGTISGALNLGGGTSTFNVADGTAAIDMLVSSVISNGGVTKTGAGLLQFSGAAANTYTGLTTVTAGTLSLNKTAGVNAIGGSALINGGTLALAAANQIPNTATVTLSSGTFAIGTFAQTLGTFIYQGGTFTQTTGALTLAGTGTALSMQNTTISGTVNLTGGGSVVFDASNNGTATISGPLNLGGATTTFNIADGTATPDMIISGVISNGGVTKTGAGELQFSGTTANTYVGLTTVSAGTLSLNKTAGINAFAGNALINGGTLSLAANDQIPNASTVTLSSGTFDMGGFSETIGTFVYNGGTFTQEGGILSLASGGNALSMRNTTIGGSIDLTGGGSVIFDATNNGTATISGPLNLGGVVTVFTIADGTAPADMLISGVISNGGLTKAGAGTLVLTGANTYSGGTIVNGGTLQGDTTSLQGNITNNANLVFDQSGTGTYSSMLSGAGTLVKQNSGTLILSNTNTSGGVTLTGGTLVVDGTLAGGGTLITSPSTRLQGVGTITKNASIGGTLAPGDSVGTINFVGNQTFLTGSALEVELTPTTNDLYNITGTLTIQPGSTLELLLDPGMYIVPSTYTIVQTTGGITGTFSGLSSSSSNFTASVIEYSPAIDPVNIILLLKAVFPEFSGNTSGLAACLNVLSDNPCGNLASVINTLHMLPTNEALEKALLQMQPSAFTSLAVAEENDIMYMKNTIYNRLDERLHSCSHEIPENIKASFWIGALGAYTSQNSHHDEPGFTAFSPGLFFGIDANLAGKWILGGGVGYTYTHLDWKQDRGNADILSGYSALYGLYAIPKGYLESMISGGYNYYSVNRYMNFGTFEPIDTTAKSDHLGLEGSAHIKGGLNFTHREVLFSPFISLDYLYLHEKGFHESGADSLNLIVQGKNSDLLATEVGIDVSSCFQSKKFSYTPFFKLSAIRESRFQGSDETASLECGCDFTVSGLYPSRTLGAFAAGVNATFSRSTLSLFYQGKYSSGYSDNSLYLQYIVHF